MRPIVVMIAWKRMLTEGSTMKSVAYYPCKPIMSQTPIKQFAPTWHCFSVRYFHTYVKIYFLSFLHHEDTEKKLHDITYEGMSTRSGCKPSCEEWTYNAIQQSYSRESMYKANTIDVLYITQIAMMWWPTTSKNILDKIYPNFLIIFRVYIWLFFRFAGGFSDKLDSSIYLYRHTDFRNSGRGGVHGLWLQRNSRNSGRLIGTICRVLILAMHVIHIG